MPEISRFLGISIKMFFDEHLPPHFHAEYGEHKARVSIDTLSVIGGSLPPRVLGLVLEWAALHRTELMELWDRASRQESLHKVPPLVE
jgi:hypothetical protein